MEVLQNMNATILFYVLNAELEHGIHEPSRDV